jgi:ankyrin repeat protein
MKNTYSKHIHMVLFSLLAFSLVVPNQHAAPESKDTSILSVDLSKFGIIASSIDQREHDVHCSTGIFTVSYAITRPCHYSVRMYDSKNRPLVDTVKKEYPVFYHYKFLYAVDQYKDTCRIWFRFPKPGTYRCEIRVSNEKFGVPEKILEYTVDAAAGSDVQGLFTAVLNGPDFDKSNENFTGRLLHSFLVTPDIIKLAMKKGVNPDIVDVHSKKTLLMESVFDLDAETAGILIDAGADVNFRSELGLTPLHCVYRPLRKRYDGKNDARRQIELCRLLLDANAEINTRDREGKTLLYVLCDKLEEHGLDNAANLPVIKYLVSRGADVNTGDIDGLNPLFVAKKGVVADFLKQNGGTMFSFQYPAGNDSALCRAVLDRDLRELARFSRDAYEKLEARTPDGIPATALHLAVAEGDTRVIKGLCRIGVNWNAPDRNKRTPLALAVLNGRRDIARILIREKANPGLEDMTGTSPYSLALAEDPEMLRILLESGITPAAKNLGIDAIASGNLEIVRMLFDYISGDTEELLKCAAYFGQTDIGEYIMRESGGSGAGYGEYAAIARKHRKIYDDWLENGPRSVSVPKTAGGTAGKTGSFTCTLEEFSPWGPEKGSFDLGDFPVTVHVPANYTDDNSFGLMLYISGDSPKKEFVQVLERNKLIWAGFNCYRIDRYKGKMTGTSPHENFYLAVVYNLLKQYTIDVNRIFMAGVSWGGRLTGRIVPRYPHVFKGGIATCGVQERFGAVENRTAPEKERRLMDCYYAAREKTALVITTTDYDFNREEAFASFNFLKKRGFRDVHFLQEPFKQHESLSGAYFDRAIQLLDGKPANRFTD